MNIFVCLSGSSFARVSLRDILGEELYPRVGVPLIILDFKTSILQNAFCSNYSSTFSKRRLFDCC